MVNQRPQTLAEVVEIACLSKEVLDEQYETLHKKEKNKNNNNCGGKQQFNSNKLRKVVKITFGRGRV